LRPAGARTSSRASWRRRPRKIARDSGDDGKTHPCFAQHPHGCRVGRAGLRLDYLVRAHGAQGIAETRRGTLADNHVGSVAVARNERALDADGLEMPETSSIYFERVLKRDIAKWTKVVKAANIRLAN
jgi:hypothetical protein